MSLKTYHVILHMNSTIILLFYFFICISANNCAWNYRYDAIDNHFNLVYPDKNAVYLMMVIPQNSSTFVVSNGMTDSRYAVGIPNYPNADYFSIQLYETGNYITSTFHINDKELMGLENLTHRNGSYEYNLQLNRNTSYIGLFRIYASNISPTTFDVNRHTILQYWSGIPPNTYIDDKLYPLCDINYTQHDNIYTNFSHDINIHTGTVCNTNTAFTFMNVPTGSLTNADANYMIACVQNSLFYNITIRMPSIMCSSGYNSDDKHPWINETYDIRYASLNLVSTNSPRPTIDSWKIPCDQENFTMSIWVDPSIPHPAFLYRQILPDDNFTYSIKSAKTKCFDYVNNRYDDKCIAYVMDVYYPSVNADI